MGSVFDVLTQDVSGQRAQYANFSIQKAAQYMQDNKNDEAIKELKKALAFDSQNSTALTYIGKLYMQQGNSYEAIKTFKTLVAQQPASVNAQVNLGNAYLQDKQYTESEKAFKTAARLDPMSPLADYTLGHQYIATDRLSEAEAQFKKVANISPRDGNVYYSLGIIYNKQGKSDAAIANLEKALRLKTNFPAANYELGVAYENAGYRDKAVEQMGILKSKDTTLYSDLQQVINKPRIVSMSPKDGFATILGPRTPLYALDPTLITPNATRTFSMTFQFSNEMDFSSVSNPLNWKISRSKDTKGGFYNNSMPATSREVSIPPIPLSVVYDPTSMQATIKFRISQNANGDAMIDPKHLVFAFKGKDAAGRAMDKNYDQIDGYSLTAY